MTQQLRDELARIADHAPPTHVAGDTWGRGRRARRRDQVVTGVVALTLVLVLGGLAALVATAPTRVSPAGPVEGPARVPDEIHAVPLHVQDDPSAYSADLAIGPQALAFVTGAGTPVVVSATDGRYRLLELEGWSGPEGHSLALSPDGTHLAIALVHGVRVIDLDTGEAREYGFPRDWFADLSWRVTDVAWTTDGEEVYYGATVGNSSEIATSRRVAVADGELTPPLLTGTIPALGPAGLFVTVEPSTVTTGPQATSLSLLSIQPPLDPTGIAYVSPDLGMIAIGNEESGGIDLFTGEDETGLTDSSSAPGLPLGWVDGDVLAVRNDSGIALRDTTDPSSADRVVVKLQSGDPDELPDHLSVATALLAEPTRDLPAPDWPWSTQRYVLVGGLALAAALLLTTVLVLVRRRRG